MARRPFEDAWGVSVSVRPMNKAGQYLPECQGHDECLLKVGSCLSFPSSLPGGGGATRETLDSRRRSVQCERDRTSDRFANGGKVAPERRVRPGRSPQDFVSATGGSGSVRDARGQFWPAWPALPSSSACERWASAPVPSHVGARLKPRRCLGVKGPARTLAFVSY
jgi:hypothetical protein